MTESSRPAALACLLLAGLTIGGALVSQHVFGLVPCKLCLWQRWPYYVGIPVALLAAVAPPGRTKRLLLLLLAAIFLASVGLGAFHAGVEWRFWPGPSDCGGGAAPAGSIDDLLRGIETTRVVSCTDAAWRFLGLSLAGWNAVVSLALVAIAAWGALPLPAGGERSSRS